MSGVERRRIGCVVPLLTDADSDKRDQKQNDLRRVWFALQGLHPLEQQALVRLSWEGEVGDTSEKGVWVYVPPRSHSDLFPCDVDGVRDRNCTVRRAAEHHHLHRVATA